VGLVLITPPAVEPVTIQEAIDHLRLDTSNVVPAPSAPTVALASPPVAGNVDNGAHRYLVTFVTADGETNAGDVSAAVTVADHTVNGQVAVTAIPTGGTSVTARKLYRTTAGGSTYLLLVTIADNATTTFTDNVADAGLGAGAPPANTTSDPVIAALIRAARSQAEKHTGASIITQTWRVTFPDFPVNYYMTDYAGGISDYGPPIVGDSGAWFNLPRGPVQSIVSITYLDASGNTQTLDPSVYVLEQSTLWDRVSLKWGQFWPIIPRQANAVTITLVCGYGASASAVGEAEQSLKSALLLRIEDLYRNRGTTRDSNEIENTAVASLLDPYVRQWLL